MLYSTENHTDMSVNCECESKYFSYLDPVHERQFIGVSVQPVPGSEVEVPFCPRHLTTKNKKNTLYIIQPR